MPSNKEYALKIAEWETLLKQGQLPLDQEIQIRNALASAYRNCGNDAAGFEESLRSSELGSVEASAVVGVSYLLGKGCEKNIDQAVVYLTKGAKAESLWATLALLSVYGQLKKDPKKYEYWLKKAADSGVPEAEFAYGVALLEGKIILARPRSGRAYLKKAALAGNGEAAYRMGKIYEEGDGVKADCVQSFAYYVLSSKAGYAPAKYLLSQALSDESSPAIQVSPEVAKQVRYGARMTGEGILVDLEDVFEKCGAYEKKPTQS